MREKKVLVKFSLPKEIEKEISDEIVNDKGETVITKRKVKETENFEFAIAKPWRSLSEDAEIFRAGQYGQALQGGALSAILLEKRYAQDDGVYTKQENEKLVDLQNQLVLLNRDSVEVNKEESTEKDKVNEINSKIIGVITEIQAIQSKARGLFNNSAEVIARNRTIIYYLVHVCLEKKDGKYVDFIKGNTYEEKRKNLDLLDDEGSDFEIRAFSVFLAAISNWMINNSITQEDIDAIVQEIK